MKEAQAIVLVKLVTAIKPSVLCPPPWEVTCADPDKTL